MPCAAKRTRPWSMCWPATNLSAARGVDLFSLSKVTVGDRAQIGRASCRERVCQYVSISVVAGPLKQKKNQQQMLTQAAKSTNTHMYQQIERKSECQYQHN